MYQQQSSCENVIDLITSTIAAIYLSLAFHRSPTQFIRLHLSTYNYDVRRPSFVSSIKRVAVVPCCSFYAFRFPLCLQLFIITHVKSVFLRWIPCRCCIMVVTTGRMSGDFMCLCISHTIFTVDRQLCPCMHIYVCYVAGRT